MNLYRLKIVSLLMLSLICVIYVSSCSDNKQNQNLWDGSGSTDNDDDDPSPTDIMPLLDWGSSISDIKAQKDNNLELLISNDTLLRYVGKKQDITIDYKFSDGYLIATSLTQERISEINDVISKWLKSYSRLAYSDNAFVYMSRDNSTVAYGRIIKGSEYDYASVAWTYVNPKEVVPDGPDYTPSGQKDGHYYVDLGAGIGWAIQNIGASAPEKFGDYYMWGETTTKSSCWWWYYSLYTGDSNSYLDTDAFFTPSSNIAGTKYDAAKAKMGNSWRMPTRVELNALLTKCQIEVGEYNGINGFIVTGSSGKSIFLPATGRKKKEDISLTKNVCLWSSTSSAGGNAYYLHLYTANPKKNEVNSDWRYLGMPIRGVIDL